MVGQEDDLTHEEIWDDSALIDSWNDALAEYKVSLHKAFHVVSVNLFRNTTASRRRVALSKTWRPQSF
jgi:hypothetical protein